VNSIHDFSFWSLRTSDPSFNVSCCQEAVIGDYY
jgi:hypothetical protein